jgi:hypothetical protein
MGKLWAAVLIVSLVVVSIPSVASSATSDPAINDAITWALNHNQQSIYDQQCLAFVTQAYAQGNIVLGSIGNGNGAAQYWAQNPKKFVEHPNNLNPPVGALVFWGPTSAPYANPYGHVGIYLGNNTVISSASWPESSSGTEVHEFSFSGRNAASDGLAPFTKGFYPYLGWIAPTASVGTPVAPASKCSPKALFDAAVAKEHFNPNDPSYAKLGPNQRPTAYGAICDGGWAFALISRPNVGTTDGFTLFRATSAGTWVEVAGTGPNNNACDLTGLGVPAKIAIVLARGVAGGQSCDLPHACSIARSVWLEGRCSVPPQLTDDVDGWPAVAEVLRASEPAYGGDPTAYKRAILDLGHVAAMANAGSLMIGPGDDSTFFISSNATFRTDMGQLDAFFRTPKLFLAPTTPACFVTQG